MTERRFYIDTSAYLGVMLGERIAKNLGSLLSQKVLCSSTLLLIESERNLVRLSRAGILPIASYHLAFAQLQKDVEKFILRDLSSDLCLTGSFPAVNTPRSSDLAHLRTARWFLDNGGLEAFVTLDKAQGNAAREFGFKVFQ
jgi:hypothetical protein